MSISVSELAKQLNIAPEAVILHAMDLDFEVGDDEMVSDEVAVKIRKLEETDEIKQTEFQIEEKIDREIVENQQKRTAGNKKTTRKKKKEDAPVAPIVEEIKTVKTDDGTIILPENITVRELAIVISKPIPIVLIKLKQNGIIANLKQSLDYDTAAIIAQELGVRVKKESAKLSSEDLFRADISRLLANEEAEHQKKRPAIVSIMGHVDHGKTSILDYIRKTKVAEGEAGGITQSIGAYQVELPDKSKITFLDTPGHEAFTVMRARGAKATDIAVLVCAVNEGLKPQSLEAINHAKEAKIPIIVAINKIDIEEPGSLDKLKKQLSEQGLVAEDWGGQTPCIPVSAKTGKGIDNLLETIKIMAEMAQLKANPDRPAIGTIIESSVIPGAGITATVLINTGTLHQGDIFIIYDQYGKIRTMKDYAGNPIKAALPSTPVQITGISKLPHVGDLLQAMDSEKEARKRSEEVQLLSHKDELLHQKKFSLATLKTKLAEGKLEQLKVIVKVDTKGVMEAVITELEKVKTDKSFVRVIHSGVGEISDSDIMLASSAGAIIVGFNTEATGRIQKSADAEGVEILTFSVIYHLTEKMMDILLGRAEKEDVEQIIGMFKIKAIFASNKKMAVLGGNVISGKIRKLCKFRLITPVKNEATGKFEDKIMGEAKIETVQLGQKEVNEANEGTECGIRVEHNGLTFSEGDQLQLFVGKKG